MDSMSDRTPAEADPAPGEEVIYEYESGKLVGAHVVRKLATHEFEIRIAPPMRRWAVPHTEKGMWEEGALLVVQGSQLRRFGHRSRQFGGDDDGDDGSAGVPAPLR